MNSAPFTPDEERDAREFLNTHDELGPEDAWGLLATLDTCRESLRQSETQRDEVRAELYTEKMTCPVCLEYGDGCNCGRITGLLQDNARMRGALEWCVGFCVNARETWPDWQDHEEIGVLFAKATAALSKCWPCGPVVQMLRDAFMFPSSPKNEAER